MRVPLFQTIEEARIGKEGTLRGIIGEIREQAVVEESGGGAEIDEGSASRCSCSVKERARLLLSSLRTDCCGFCVAKVTRLQDEREGEWGAAWYGY